MINNVDRLVKKKKKTLKNPMDLCQKQPFGVSQNFEPLISLLIVYIKKIIPNIENT